LIDESEEEEEEAILLNEERVVEENMDLNSGTAEMMEASCIGGRNPTKAARNCEKARSVSSRLVRIFQFECELTSEVITQCDSYLRLVTAIDEIFVLAFLFRFLLFELRNRMRNCQFR